MKTKLTLSLILSLVTIVLKAQTTYYYDGSGALSSTANWWTQTNGTGSNPNNFTANNRIYEIRNTTSVTLSTNWTVSGNNSKVVLGNSALSAITLTHSGGTFSGTIDIATAQSGSNTLVLQHSSSPTLGSLASGSTVQYSYAGAQNVQAKTYHHLTISGSRGSNNITLPSGGTINITGVFNPIATFSSGRYITTNNTIGFISSSSQTIPAFNYNNLTCSSTGQRILSNSGIISIAGTFTSGTNTYTIGTSTVLFTSGTTNIPVLSVTSGANYYNLELASSRTIAGSLEVGNNFTLTSGTLTVNNASSKVLTVNNFIQTGGAINFNAGTSGTSVIAVKGNFTQTAGTSTTSAFVSNGAFHFSGSEGPQTISITSPNNNTFVNYTITSGAVAQLASNIAISVTSQAIYNGKLTIENGATLNLGEFKVLEEDADNSGGACVFTLSAGGNIITTHASGLSGNISGPRTTQNFNSGANYEFYGPTTGIFNTTPAAKTVNNLTINNSNSTTLPQSLTVNGILNFVAGKLNIAEDTLTINGSLSGIATFIGSASTCINIGGTGALDSHLYMDQTNAATRTINNLTLNRTASTVTLGNTMELTGTLTLSNGTMAAEGNLILISTEVQTARIATIPAGADITGNVTVQRFIPAVARRYRMLSPSTSGFTYADFKDDILVSGLGGAANGFDATSQNQTSIYTFQEGGSEKGWKPATNINNSILPGQGTFTFIRGDRTLPSPQWYTAPYVSQNEVIIDFNGPINKGIISPPVSYTNTGNSDDDGWNLIGNPYPSQIDWTLVSKTNLAPFTYSLDPNTNSYVANDGSQVIASGQAFFVQATGASPTVTFTESCKVSSAPLSLFKSVSNKKFTIKMVQDAINSDVAWLKFTPGASYAYNVSEDALKFTNSTINMGFVVPQNNTQVQYNSVPILTNVADTFNLFANAASGPYTLEFSEFQAVPATKAILLKDLFTNTITDVRVNSIYAFSITSDPVSYGQRFDLIIIDQNALPVEIISLEADKSTENDVLVKWATASENNNKEFVIERSFNNQSFEGIGKVNGFGYSNTKINYEFIDGNAVTAAKNSSSKNVYYRIRQIDFSGTTSISNVVTVNIEKSPGHIQNELLQVFPNPTKGKFVIRNYNDAVKTMVIADITGKVVLSFSEDILNPYEIDLTAFESGIYFLSVNNSSRTYKIIKE